jgi:hypothetical protein
VCSRVILSNHYWWRHTCQWQVGEMRAGNEVPTTQQHNVAWGSHEVDFIKLQDNKGFIHAATHISVRLAKPEKIPSGRFVKTVLPIRLLCSHRKEKKKCIIDIDGAIFMFNYGEMRMGYTQNKNVFNLSSKLYKALLNIE